jgi:hypothetical protein
LPTPQVFIIKIIPIPWMNIEEISFMNFQWMNGCEYGQIFMDEKLKIDGMKFIHVIIVVKKTP